MHTIAVQLALQALIAAAHPGPLPPALPAQAAAVGKLPAEVLQGDLQALAEGKPLPFARVRGQASPMQRPETTMMGPSKQAGPLDHF